MAYGSKDQLRIFGGRWRRCWVDDKGNVVRWRTYYNGEIVTPEQEKILNENKKVEIEPDKLEPNEKIVLTDKETITQPTDDELTDDEIKEIDKIKDEIMAEDIERIVEKILSQRDRDLRIRAETDELKQKVEGMAGVVDSKLEGFVGNISTKLDDIKAVATEAKNKNSITEIMAKGKTNTTDIDCPNCKKAEGGHNHKLKPTPDGLKCSGDHCGKEFFIVPKETHYDSYCENCGMPLNSQSGIDSCPGCKGTKGVRI